MTSCRYRLVCDKSSTTIPRAFTLILQGLQRACASKTLLRVWSLLLSAMLASQAFAQTPVSGAIAVDTHWTVDDAPYVVSGDVVVQNGADLTIDPGVTVYMAPVSSLTVQSGGILALGTDESPIRVLSDKVRNGQLAGPGDYKAWTFNPGTTVQTRLEHVLFQHGSGLVVNGSAPTFNYLDLRDHQGAAITIDLAASPGGVGNKASGNGMNGIAVPAGDIVGNVQWGLLGIPYIVSSGTVSVGTSPIVTEIQPAAVQRGETVVLTLTGTRLTGLAQVSFAAEGVSATVMPGGTATQAQIEVTATEAASVGTSGMLLLVDAGEVNTGSALTIALSQPVITDVAPDRVYVGQGEVSIAINGRGFTSQSVAQINGNAIATQFDSSSQLHATVPNQIVASNLSLRLRTPDATNPGQYLTSNEFILPVEPAQIVLTPDTATAVKGTAKEFTLTLPYLAPAGGVNVALVSSVPAVASVPATIAVAEGSANATFNLTAIDVGSTLITASKSGLVSGQAQVNVISPPMLSITPNFLNLGVGRTAQISVQLSEVAPEGGLQVSLFSSDAGMVSVPSAVTIPAGEQVAAFTVVGNAIGMATIQAQAGDLSAEATINVRSLSLGMPYSILVVPGQSRSIALTLSDPAPVGGLVAALSSSDPTLATVPASITVPEGAVSADFTLNGIADGAVEVSVEGVGYESATMHVTIQMIEIGIGAPSVSAIALPLGLTKTYTLTLSHPAPTAEGVTIDLSVDNPSVATVSPSSITIAEGQTSSGAITLALSGIATGTTTLHAIASGLNPASVPVTVPEEAVLRFSSPSAIIGKGLKNCSDITVERSVNGEGFMGEAMQVNLTSSDPAKVSVPANVTIQAGYHYANFCMSGLDLTGGSAVTIDATADGFISPSEKLQASAMAPEFEFYLLDTNRNLASPRDYFGVSVAMPGAAYPTSQTAVADMPIDVSIVDSVPAGIVAGFYNAETGGAATTQVLLLRNRNSSDPAYVGVPSVAGNYKVQASTAGIASVTSGVVTVSAVELKFSGPTVVVGKGFKTSFSVYRSVDGVPLNDAVPMTVTLSVSDPGKVSVPATITIPAGSAYASFEVIGVDLTGDAPASIDATVVGDASLTASMQAGVETPVLTFTGLDTLRSPASERNDFRVNVQVPGDVSSFQSPVTDLLIDVSIVEADPAGIVDGLFNESTGGIAATTMQVLLRAGNNESDVAYVGTPTVSGSYRVQASAEGIASVISDLVSVASPELRFTSNVFGEIVVGKGFRTHGYAVSVERTGTNGSWSGSWADAVTVTLTSSEPGKVSVPATVTIPAGRDDMEFEVTGVDLTGDTPVTITAAAAGYIASPLPPTEGESNTAPNLQIRVVAPIFEFRALDTYRDPSGGRDNFRLSVGLPDANVEQSLATQLPFDLSIVEADPTGIVDGFYSALTGDAATSQVLLRPGEAGSDYVYVGVPTAPGGYRVKASAAGFGSVISDNVTVGEVELKFSQPSVIVGKGLKIPSWAIQVARSVNGTDVNASEPLTVTLSSSDPGKVSVPATVTIPAGGAHAGFEVTGVGLTAGAPVTIDATVDGDASLTASMQASVVAPVLTFNDLDTHRSPASDHDDFSVRVQVPGSGHSYQTLIADLPINLSIVEGAPAGIVDGFYRVTESGLEQTNAVLLREQSAYSDPVYVGTPTAMGSYKVEASAAGFATLTSDVVTVAAPQLEFSSSIVVVGKGLKTFRYEVSISRTVDGVGVNEAEPLTVTLTSSDPGKMSVPATVTIPAGSASESFEVSGLDLGDATISAAATGYPLESDLHVNVVTPELRFYPYLLSDDGMELDPPNVQAGSQAYFAVGTYVPGAEYPEDQTVIAATPINVISNHAEVATATAQVTIQAGDAYSEDGILTGVAPGTTTLTGSSTGYANFESFVISISP